MYEEAWRRYEGCEINQALKIVKLEIATKALEMHKYTGKRRQKGTEAKRSYAKKTLENIDYVKVR